MGIVEWSGTLEVPTCKLPSLPKMGWERKGRDGMEIYGSLFFSMWCSTFKKRLCSAC